MDIFHRIFEQEISSNASGRLITELICAKLAKKGIVLSRKQKQAVMEKVAVRGASSFNLASWKFWKTERVHLEITSEDIAVLERSFEDWLNRIPELFDGLSTQLVERLLPDLKRRWPRHAKQEGTAERRFQSRLDKRWGKPFGLLGMLLAIANEFGESLTARLRSAPPASPYLVEVLTRLHARACQVTAEVFALLRAGFADGALARWRTLHEIAVVGLFISEGGENLAERYALHDATESRRAALEYQRYQERLGYEPLRSDELDALEGRVRALTDRFGPSFGDQYGWASERLACRKPKFVDIERSVQIDYLRPYYRMASHNVHANPKGVFFKLGLLDEAQILLAGASDMGLADSGQNAALSLLHATRAVVSLDPNIDAIIILKLMMQLCDEAGESFVEVQEAIQHGVA